MMILYWQQALAIPFSRGSFQPGIKPGSLALQADFTIWATREVRWEVKEPKYFWTHGFQAGGDWAGLGQQMYLRCSELPTGPVLGSGAGEGAWVLGWGVVFLTGLWRPLFIAWCYHWGNDTGLTGHLELGNIVACIDLGGAQIQVNKCFLSQSRFLCAYKIKIPCNFCIFTPIRCWFNRGHHDTNSRTLLASQGPCSCPALGGSLLSCWVSGPCAPESSLAAASWCP